MANWCELGANITTEKCRSYRKSGSSICRGCQGIHEVGAIIEPAIPEAEEQMTEIKYPCVEDGCRMARVKNKRCTAHNREYEAALLKLELEVGKLKKEDISAFLPLKTEPPPFRAKHYATPTQKPKESQMPEQTAKGGSLDRLLKKPTPLPETSIVLNFAPDEYAAIQDEKVTHEEIKELVLLLIAGELEQVVKH
jgi:hypothetical protein